ncbi:ureidoglycolate lyase [Advenella mimigardefordensis]|uniref:Putative ureidoglycolate hydrolase n=1 Tax=Advenella mimigardefordensis (strain DSM 17166 / LMG 22922 / DPN7) TaxID=1247726 RepID=W0PG68_ADVMD|nr:ureidoglycolate lyase [Advenella mimigardefordensis]AHG64083.1 putative ureidoglycolate hydrolase [Advenella mimigardefordensis DPN7]
MNTPVISTVELHCEIADEVSFAPFGMLVRRPEKVAANLASGAVESWRLPFTSGSDPQIMFNRYHDKGREFSVMEKHLHVSQCFFPLGGVPYIMVVGKGSDGRQSVAPSDVRAFYIEGDCGVLLWQDVWHSLARFPVGAAYIDLAFITDHDTQHEIERHLAGGPLPQQTEFVDFAHTHQTRFLVQDPQGRQG